MPATVPSGMPGVNVALPALPEQASQTVAASLMRGGSAVGTGVFALAVCGGAYWLVRRLITAYRHAHLVNQVGEDSKAGLAIGYAQRLYSAMNSGHEWWNDWFGDGTDEDAMYQVGREMHHNQVSFSLVSSKYKTLYNRELINDITNELNAEEQAKFQAAMSTGLGGLPALGSVGLLKTFLYTNAPTVVFDRQLHPLGQVPPRMKLGLLVETLTAPTGEVWLGFAHQQQMRYVSALAVSTLPL